jgi:hypothetical protein
MSKSQNRRPLFDVELYLTVYKSLSQLHYILFIVVACTFRLSLLDDHFIIRKCNRKYNHTAISIKVVHEQSGKVEYERKRLLGIALKIH